MLVNFRALFTSAVEDQETGHRHAGEEWGFPRVEGAAGGDVRAAAVAPELSRYAVPAGSPERADGGAAQVGRPDAGAVTELQAAGGNAAPGACRGRRAGEPPPQQERPGGSSDTKSRGEGYDDGDDILHGSCKCLNVGSLFYCILQTVYCDFSLFY